MAKAKKAAAKKLETKKTDVSSKGNALDRAIAQIEKQYGDGSIMKMDESKHRKIEGISTGALSLDIALGGSLAEAGLDEAVGMTIRPLGQRPTTVEIGLHVFRQHLGLEVSH